MEDGFKVVANKKARKKKAQGTVKGEIIKKTAEIAKPVLQPQKRASNAPGKSSAKPAPAKPVSQKPATVNKLDEKPVTLPRTVNEYIENPALIEELASKNELKTLLSQLPEHAVEARMKIKEKDNDLLSLWDIIETINKHELKYLTLLDSCSEPLEKLSCSKEYYAGPQTSEYLEPGLINVFDKYESFRLQPVSEEEKKIPFLFISKSKPFRPRPEQEPVYAVPTRAEFLRRFEIFTAKQFDGWKDWSNMVVVGGAVCNCLLSIPPSFANKTDEFYHKVAYKTSDIDIYCYGLSNKQLNKKIFDFYTYLFRKGYGTRVLVFNTPHTVTLVTAFPQRHIQFVIGQWKSIEHILFEPDVDCSCVAFDGSNVWATQRSKFSLTHRAIVSSPTRRAVRGFPEYESRLVKYSKRGFMIWDRRLDWRNVSEHYIRMAHTRIGERVSCTNRARVAGLRLLIALHSFKDQFKTIDMMTVLSGDYMPGNKFFIGMGIPYGEKWTTERIAVAHQKGRFRYTSNYGVIQAIDRENMQMHEYIYEPREMFATALVRESHYVDSWKETGWYEYVFRDDFLNEITVLKNQYRDSSNPDLTYALANFYDYRTYNWEEKPTFKELMCIPPYPD